jgi:hypothetical protein
VLKGLRDRLSGKKIDTVVVDEPWAQRKPYASLAARPFMPTSVATASITNPCSEIPAIVATSIVSAPGTFTLTGASSVITGGSISASKIGGGSISVGTITYGGLEKQITAVSTTLKAMAEAFNMTGIHSEGLRHQLEQAGISPEVAAGAIKDFNTQKQGANVAKAKMTEQEKFLISTAMDDIIAAVKDDVFVVDHTPTVTMKLADGQFRNKPIFRGWEFFLTEAYIGGRDQLLLCFTPVDAQEFASIELVVGSADEVFPLLGGAIAKSLQVEGESLDAVIDAVRLKKVADAAREAKEAAVHVQANPLWGRF